MSEINPYRERAALSRRDRRAVELAQRDTAWRVQKVLDDATVEATKLREVDHLAFRAMTGQAMLSKAASGMAQDDPFLAAELRFFTDIARLSKGELLADFAQDLRRRR